MMKSGDPLIEDLASLYQEADARLDNKEYETARYYYMLAKNEIQSSRYKEGNRDRRLLAIQLSLSKTYILEKKAKEAKNYASKAMKMAKKLKDQLQIAQCLDIESDIKQLQGKTDQALDILHKALQIKLTVVDSNHIQVAYSYHKLGKIYTDQTKYQLALPLYLKSLKIMRQLIPGNSTEVAQLYHNIGTIYSFKQQHDDALENYKLALTMNISLNNDPNAIGNSYWCLAITFYRQFKYKESLKMHRNALETLNQKYEENHPIIARSYYHLGLVHYKLVNYQEALQMHEKALAIRFNIQERNLPDIVLSYQKLALTLDQLGRYQEAIDALSKALNINIKLHGRKHVNIASNYNDMGMIYRHLSLYHQSRSMYEKAIDILTDLSGDHYDLITAVRDNMAVIDDTTNQLSALRNRNPSSSSNPPDDVPDMTDKSEPEASQEVSMNEQGIIAIILYF